MKGKPVPKERRNEFRDSVVGRATAPRKAEWPQTRQSKGAKRFFQKVTGRVE